MSEPAEFFRNTMANYASQNPDPKEAGKPTSPLTADQVGRTVFLSFDGKRSYWADGRGNPLYLEDAERMGVPRADIRRTPVRSALNYVYRALTKSR